jgi:hypothetical protein
MATENKTQETDSSVHDFISSLGNEQVIDDCLKLIAMMTKISGYEPKMWGPSIIGFGKYHYKYATGREGDMPVIAFAPRKGKLVLYLEQELIQFSQLLEKLGKHTTSKACLYIKRLSDVDEIVLAQIIKDSFDRTMTQ